MFRTLLFVIAFSLPALASHTYSIVEYDLIADGWSLDGGTLVTNGFVGVVEEPNLNDVITDWSIGMTSPSGSYVFTPANSVLAIDYHVAGGTGILDVDPQRMLIPFNAFGYELSVVSNAGQAIVWHGPDYSDDISGLIIDGESIVLTDGDDELHRHFGACFEGEPNCSLPDGRVVATVPEPAAWIMLSFVVGAIRIQNRRRCNNCSALFSIDSLV